MNVKMDAITDTPAFTRLSKVLYLKIILEELKKDPNLWKTFSHEKQVELHKIKAELDAFYAKKAHLKEVLGPYGEISDYALTKLVEEEL